MGPDNAKELRGILNTLNDIRQSLAEVNEKTGGMERYRAIRREIEDLGWGNICAKYHPDINTQDPASHELFSFYRFVRETMENKK